jgi:hypothetical protein
VREAYSVGCPDLSPNRRELLLTANTAAGAAEIRRSTNPDGSDAKPVTPGADPVWLMNGEEFVYSIDGAHVAVFSLPTMKFRLLADPGLGTQPSVLGKAVSTQGAVAVMFYGSDTQWAVAVYEGADLNQRTAFGIPGARNFRFAPEGDRLFIAPLEMHSPLTALDWRTSSYRNVGGYGDTDLIDAVVSGETAAVLARKRSMDVWLYEGSARRRLTTDGENDAAAISPKGELLLAKPGAVSTEHIWAQSPDGRLRKVTNGPKDTSPEFSPDGSSWLYVDYERRNIMICGSGTDQCRILRHDDMLPIAPHFSPDGSKIAYVRLGAVSQLMVFSVTDGREWPLGGTHWQCQPVWASPKTVLAFEGSSAGYSWVEKEIETGLRTGRRIKVTDDQSAVNDELDCWPKGVEATSPLFRKVRVETEETSTVLRVPSRQLTH